MDIKATPRKYCVRDIIRKLKLTERDYYIWTYDSGRFVLENWIDIETAYEIVDHFAKQGNEIAKRYKETVHLDSYLVYDVDTKVEYNWTHDESKTTNGVPNAWAIASNMVRSVGFEPNPTRKERLFAHLCQQLMTKNPNVNTLVLKEQVFSRSSRAWKKAVLTIVTNTNFGNLD